MARRVLAVTTNFPAPRFPERGVFVKNFLEALGAQGISVDVIAPSSRLAELKYRQNPPAELCFGPLRVVQPSITTLPMRVKGAERFITSFNERRFASTVEAALRADSSYDFAYAHFLPAGRAVLRATELRHRELSERVFLNLGESDPWDYDALYGEEWVRALSRFAGIVTVSRKNYDYLLARNGALEAALRYIPNGVDTALFKPLDRTECRAALGLPQEADIALFCGHFDRRKGPLRVLEAIRRLGVKGIFIGSNGPDVPAGPEVLFAGSVPNSAMPTWYGAADVFVLPSLSEGMSNAILEALACGLPLVVANLDFNTSFLDSACAAFVDPRDPEDIARGVAHCLSPSNRLPMREASLRLSRNFSLAKRAKSVLAFVEGRLSERSARLALP